MPNTNNNIDNEARMSIRWQRHTADDLNRTTATVAKNDNRVNPVIVQWKLDHSDVFAAVDVARCASGMKQ